jgi:hypothetical protein
MWLPKQKRRTTDSLNKTKDFSTNRLAHHLLRVRTSRKQKEELGRHAMDNVCNVVATVVLGIDHLGDPERLDSRVTAAGGRNSARRNDPSSSLHLNLTNDLRHLLSMRSQVAARQVTSTTDLHRSELQ